MKNIILIGFALFSLQFISAQEISTPLPNVIEQEVIPSAPSADHTWVKGHWQYDAGKYHWVDGAYVETLANHDWVDGKWVKNQTTNKWFYQKGSWSQNNSNFIYNGKTYTAASATESNVIQLIQVQNLSLN